MSQSTTDDKSASSDPSDVSSSSSANARRTASNASSTSSLFRIPPPLKRLFDRFPLHTYPPNNLPLRSPTTRNEHTLYIFSAPTASASTPSHNPTSLKWQTLLHIAGIPFTTRPSTNHASPTGSLPFLIPAHTPPNTVPLTGGALTRWITSHTPIPPSPALTPTERAYTTLLAHPIRLAYLYTLYLHPPTFTHTTSPLYVDAASSSSFVRYCLSGPLRAAALKEITSSRTSTAGKVDVEQLFRDAEEAFEALGVLLEAGGREWFKGVNADADGTSEASGRREYTTNGPESDMEGEGEGGRVRASGTHSEASDEFAAQGGQHRDSSFGLFDSDSGLPSRAGSPPPPQANVHALGSRNGDGRGTPGALDAAVFSHVHVILELFGEEARRWEELRVELGGYREEQAAGEAWSPGVRLVRAIEKAGAKGPLVRHRGAMLQLCYEG